MKKIGIFLIIIFLIYKIVLELFIYIFPPTLEEVYGKYKSFYSNEEYTLDILRNKESIFEIRRNGELFYKEKCTKLTLEKMGYRRFPIYNLSFSGCDNMNSDVILKKDISSGIKIINNGYEGNRIDPDSDIFFYKIKKK